MPNQFPSFENFSSLGTSFKIKNKRKKNIHSYMKKTSGQVRSFYVRKNNIEK